MEQRPLFLLAAKRLQDPRIKTRAANKAEETRARLQLIKQRLEEARGLAAEQPLESGRLCADILDLYRNYPDFHDDPDLKQLVEQAQQLMDQIAPRREQKR